MNKRRLFGKRRLVGLRMITLKVLKQETKNNNPLSATELIDMVFQMTRHIWKPSPGSIYPVLDKLESKGQIKNVNKDTPDKTSRYVITELGLEKVQRLLTNNLEFMIVGFSMLYEDFELDKSLLFERTEMEQHFLEKMEEIPFLSEQIKADTFLVEQKLNATSKLIDLLNEVKQAYQQGLRENSIGVDT